MITYIMLVGRDRLIVVDLKAPGLLINRQTALCTIIGCVEQSWGIYFQLVAACVFPFERLQLFVGHIHNI